MRCMSASDSLLRADGALCGRYLRLPTWDRCLRMSQATAGPAAEGQARAPGARLRAVSDRRRFFERHAGGQTSWTDYGACPPGGVGSFGRRSRRSRCCRPPRGSTAAGLQSAMLYRLSTQDGRRPRGTPAQLSDLQGEASATWSCGHGFRYGCAQLPTPFSDPAVDGIAAGHKQRRQVRSLSVSIGVEASVEVIGQPQRQDDDHKSGIRLTGGHKSGTARYV